ncbi:MAG: DUF6049 family protein [Marmoricola sp.]
MIHVRRLRARLRWPAVLAAVALVGLSPTVAAAAPASAASHGTGRTVAKASQSAKSAKDSAEPLTVQLTSLSPSTVPKSGPLRLTGTVTNDSAQEWQAINVHAFVSDTPMTTADELATAAATPYDADVGARLQTAHAFAAVGDLAPGETTAFRLRVPRSELPIPDRPGVYWVGAHALGANTEGRDGVADGRARTFIPLYRARKTRVPVALVLPFRAEVRRTGTGALRDPARWQQLLRPDGRLGRVLGIAESAGSAALTLAVDPAVLDAVTTDVEGPVDPGAPVPTGTPSPTPTPTPSATPSPEGDTAQTKPDAATAGVGTNWLKRFGVLAHHSRVLGVGYADPDLAALAQLAPELLTESYALGAETFKNHGVRADPAAVPADGHLPSTALSKLGRDTLVLLDDRAAPGGRVRWRTTAGQPLVVADAATATGGPGPSAATSALALRQRIVAEAALHGLSGSRAPLVVDLPADWDPGADWRRSRFFAAMTDLPWLTLTGLDGAGSPNPPVRTDLVYPASRSKAQVDARLVTAAKGVVGAARTYADAVTTPAGVVASYTRLALQGTSYHGREHEDTSLAQSRDLAATIRARLASIRVVGSSFVTLSGGSGSFVVTLVNNLGRPVRIGLRAQTGTPNLTITSPGTVVLQPKQRTTVKLHATAADIGVRQVRLVPVTRHGDPVGTPIAFTIRSSQVSSLIWAVMALGATLLVVMILRRALKRGLHREKPVV